MAVHTYTSVGSILGALCVVIVMESTSCVQVFLAFGVQKEVCRLKIAIAIVDL